jgi:hypothetical protein
MRHSLAAVAVAALSTAALAQEQPAAQAPQSAWQNFEQGEMKGAVLQAADGSQLVIKCDKPGRREVYAMIVSPEKKLAAPSSRPVSRPIRFMFDDKSPSTENWRFYEQYTTALGKTSDRALPRFIVDLRKASKLRMILNTGIGPDVEMEFDVTGAGDAVTHVYEACNDREPA